MLSLPNFIVATYDSFVPVAKLLAWPGNRGFDSQAEDI